MNQFSSDCVSILKRDSIRRERQEEAFAAIQRLPVPDETRCQISSGHLQDVAYEIL